MTPELDVDPKAHPITRQSRILVVDDERHIARLLEHFLVKEGYSVTVAHDAERAYDLMATFLPDAMVLDFVLPGMSGLELIRKLRNEPRWANLVVIVLSAKWFNFDDRALSEAGATAHCPKPIAPSKLIRKLCDCGIPPQLCGLGYKVIPERERALLSVPSTSAIVTGPPEDSALANYGNDD